MYGLRNLMGCRQRRRPPLPREGKVCGMGMATPSARLSGQHKAERRPQEMETPPSPAHQTQLHAQRLRIESLAAEGGTLRAKSRRPARELAKMEGHGPRLLPTVPKEVPKKPASPATVQYQEHLRAITSAKVTIALGLVRQRQRRQHRGRCSGGWSPSFFGRERMERVALKVLLGLTRCSSRSGLRSPSLFGRERMERAALKGPLGRDRQSSQSGLRSPSLFSRERAM